MQLKVKLRSLAVSFNTSDHTEYDRDLSFAESDRVAPNFYNSDSSEEEDEDSVNGDSGNGGAARRGGMATRRRRQMSNRLTLGIHTHQSTLRIIPSYQS
jgi:hypothetical protein